MHDNYLECMAVYRAFCEKALCCDVLFFHASAVALDGERLSVHRAFRHWEIHPCENVEGGFWKRSCS